MSKFLKCVKLPWILRSNFSFKSLNDIKINPWGFGIIFFIAAVYFMANDFQMPNFFLFQRTDKVKATIVEIKPTYGIKGRILQLLIYEYKVEDSLYQDRVKGGFGYGHKRVGDQLLVEYLVRNPQKNEVIGQYN